MARTVQIGKVKIGGKQPLAMCAGACVIESRKQCMALARKLAALSAETRIPLVFKASYDKANRSSQESYRGPGLSRGLEILQEVKETVGVPVMTDVHSVAEIAPVARVADILQVPAFLCRQTDLVVVAGETGLPVNIKKGQFLSFGDAANLVTKFESTGNRKLLLTERGTSFGYNNLVVDMRSIPAMTDLGCPVVFDATHSVQRPGGAGTRSHGDSEYAPPLARAAVAAGCDAVFFETFTGTHMPLCDAHNAIRFTVLKQLLPVLKKIHETVR